MMAVEQQNHAIVDDLTIERCWILFVHVVQYIQSSDDLIKLADSSILLRAKCVHECINRLQLSPSWVFKKAKDFDCIDTAIWMYSRFPNVSYSVPSSLFAKKAIDLARKRDISGLNWLLTHRNYIPKGQAAIRPLVVSCCSENGAGVAKWFISKMERNDILNTFQLLVCGERSISNNTEILPPSLIGAKRLSELIEISTDEIRKMRVFLECLTTDLMNAKPNVEIAKWIAEKWKLTSDDVRAQSNVAIRLLCSSGNLETAKWLFNCFKLTKEDLKTYNNFALSFATMNGHLQTVQWLVEEVGLNSEEDLKPVFQTATKLSHQNIISWLNSYKHLNQSKVF